MPGDKGVRARIQAYLELDLGGRHHTSGEFVELLSKEENYRVFVKLANPYIESAKDWVNLELRILHVMDPFSEISKYSELVSVNDVTTMKPFKKSITKAAKRLLREFGVPEKPRDTKRMFESAIVQAGINPEKEELVAVPKKGWFRTKMVKVPKKVPKTKAELLLELEERLESL